MVALGEEYDEPHSCFSFDIATICFVAQATQKQGVNQPISTWDPLMPLMRNMHAPAKNQPVLSVCIGNSIHTSDTTASAPLNWLEDEKK